MTRQPEILSPTSDGLSQAVKLLRAGQLIGLPTETVYGLAADARNDRAVAEIFAAKGRPTFNPLICHVPSLEAAEAIAEISATARDLAQAFWPGPLTLVVPLKPGHGLSPLVSAGLETVALRVPAHPVAQAVLEAFGAPIAAPSANPSGRISPTEAAHVAAGLGPAVAAVLDAGPCSVGLESTIIGVSGAPILLREGGLPREAIEAMTGSLRTDLTPGRVAAPGQMASHYAPAAPVHVDIIEPRADNVRIGFGPDTGADFNLSPSGDLIEAAAALFATLHQADAMAADQGVAIDVAPIPERGLGRAINDRLRRASAPR